jgi:class 3 adenylate cyclase/tetratricopeptide (TPR) repeat protein
MDHFSITRILLTEQRGRHGEAGTQMGDLHRWLESIGLGQYADLLAAHDIDRDSLVLLKEEDFDKLGISLGHRRILVNAATEYQRSGLEPDRPSGIVRSVDSGAERRHLTVLFCDIAGSTKLSVRLDPEELAEVLREFQSRCSDAIRQYDGYVARFMGDGILAYFGFPQAHEDDAERAVNAALKIVAWVSTSRSSRVQRIKVRIGIASGLVVVGDLVGEGLALEFALVGEAPNLAARLQQLAKPNQVLVSSGTRRLLGSRFVLDDVGERTAKGFGRQVRIWRVLKSNPVESRFEARQASPMTRFVGRELELAFLHDNYRMAERGQGRLVLISGEPGIGKSRLAMALAQQVSREAARVLSFQCSPYHMSSAWYPVVRHLEDAAGIDPDSVSTLKLQKLETFVAQRCASSGKEFFPVLAALLNVPTDDRYVKLELSPPQLKTRTFAALLMLFRPQREEGPVILVFEDVHWIDPTSLEFLERLRDEAQSCRMLVLVLVRPEFTLPWMDLPHVAGLTLNQFNKREAAAIIEAVAGQESLPRETIDQIVAKTDGVPLFVEEMTKAVLETSDRTTAGSGGKAHSASSLPVPDTLHESLMARLDQLESPKTIAQTAAVIGREFRLDLLEAVASAPKRDVHAAIDRLLASGLLYRSGNLGDHHFTFKHALVQEEAYASLLHAERRRLHRQIAVALTERFTTITERAPEIAAHHFTQAGQTRTAIDYWFAAGRQASERFAFIEASTHFRTALDLAARLPAAPERDGLEMHLQYSLGVALSVWKGFAAVETELVFARARELYGRVGPSAQSVSVLSGLISVHITRGEFEQSRNLAEEILTYTQFQDHPTALLIGHRALGISLFVTGELSAARVELQNAVDLYDMRLQGPLTFIFSHDAKVTALSYMALTAALQFDFGDALKNGEDAVAHAEQLRHPHSSCFGLAFLGGVHLLQGNLRAVVPIVERYTSLAQEYGFTQWIAAGHLQTGWLRLEVGDARQAVADLRRAIETMEETGALTWVQFARCLLGAALLEAGECDEAVDVINHEILKLAGTSGRWYEAELHRVNGNAQRLRGDLAAAETCYQAAIAAAERPGALLWQLRAENDLATLCQAQGRNDEARARLARLYAHLGRDVATKACKDLQVTRGLLGEAGGKRNGGRRQRQIR